MPPWPILGSRRRLLKRLRGRLLIVGGVPSANGKSMMAAARERGMAVVETQPTPPADAEVLRLLHQTNRQRLEGAAGAPAAKASPWRALGLSLAPAPKPWTSVESLAGDLGRPRTILCLGNGPTSADPALSRVPHDVLFRVNWSWAPNPGLPPPALVFTALQATLQKVDARCAFVFKDASTAARIVDDRPLRRSPLRYAVADQLGLFDPAQLGGFTLTNGAVMLALAVALAPERLVVAGMDLFSDPAGAYAHQPGTVNDYTAGHSRDLEREFLCAVLKRYRGALDIRSPQLAEALAASR